MDDLIAVLVTFVFGERGIDDMTKVWLQTNVEEARDGEDLVDDLFAMRCVYVGGDEKVLNVVE